MNVANNDMASVTDSSCFIVNAPDVPRDTPNAPSMPVTMRRLRESLFLAVTEDPDKTAMLSAVARVVSAHACPEATFFFERDQSSSLLAVRTLGDKSDSVSDTLNEDLLSCAEAACAQGQPTAHRLNRDVDLLALSVPVHLPDNEPEVLAAIFPPNPSALEHLIGVLETAATHITLWYVQQDVALKESEAQSTAALQDLLAKIESCRDLRHGGGMLVDELQQYVGCQRLALTMCDRRHGRPRLQSISGSQKFDKHSPFVLAVEAALDEAILRDTLTVWPPMSSDDRHAALAHQKLCSVADVQCVVSSPLRDPHGDAVGAWLFLGTKECLEDPNVLNLIRASEPRIASCLSLLRRIEGGPIAKLRRSLLDSKRSWKTKVALLILCVLIGAMFLPMRYKIRCDCRLEPVSRRFVAAPHDGILQKALVMSGATVAEGEVLAQMDGREIRWELAGVTAERDRAVKQSEAAFANRKFAAANVAKLEVDRLELKMELLEQRQRNLDVKSAIDGVVIVGDLNRAEGAPVTCGQALFEIAPLEEMTVEVAIPQRDIPYVRVGQQVVVHLEACPDSAYHATIDRIRPRSEIREQRNVFVAELTLPNTEENLRPGMHGLARIIGPRRLLAWNLFHKPWDSLCMTLSW